MSSSSSTSPTTPSSTSLVISREFTQICEKTSELGKRQGTLSVSTPAGSCCGSTSGGGGNRYSNILPNETTRVVLQVTPSNGLLTDYINANLIEYESKCYILCQAPLPSTMLAFWTMVWQKKSPVIISLNRLFEGNTRKGDPYWPAVTGDSVHFGVMRVTLISTRAVGSSCSNSVNISSNYDGNGTINGGGSGLSSLAVSVSGGGNGSGSGSGSCANTVGSSSGDILIRTLHVRNMSDETEETREILQIHYLGWPDFGVPESTQPIRDIIHLFNLVRKENTLEGPPVIHCSAGVGRTGSLVGIMCALQKPLFYKRVDEFKRTNESEISLFFRQSQKTEHLIAQLTDFVGSMNVKDIVLSLRRQRHSSTVQTPKQYDLIYQALMDETLCPGPSREVTAFYESYAKQLCPSSVPCPSSSSSLSSSCSSPPPPPVPASKPPLSPHILPQQHYNHPLTCHEEYEIKRKLKIKPLSSETELF